jgi:hypothetical protein
MNDRKDSYSFAMEEIKDAANDKEKSALLQKYGMIDPILTTEEQNDVLLSQALGEG